jgi:regulator of protease activity HflC (stomatin/prohibitin superfamily)
MRYQMDDKNYSGTILASSAVMPPEVPVLLVALVVSSIAILALLGASLFTVDQRTAAIVQRFGKFMREAGPGIQLKIPLVDRVVGRVNLRVQQLDVEIETKTEDNVFVRMVVAVQYYVQGGGLADGHLRAAREGLRRILQARRRAPADHLVRV